MFRALIQRKRRDIGAGCTQRQCVETRSTGRPNRSDFSLADLTGTNGRCSPSWAEGRDVVFYRSADWCPYCKTQLLELQSQYDTLRKDGLGSSASATIHRTFSRLQSAARHHDPAALRRRVRQIKRYWHPEYCCERGSARRATIPDVIARVKLYVSANGRQ
jgi:hypothetical protein